MEKSKLGISAGFMAAATYLLAAFGGYTAAILVVGYILLMEENKWLKKEGLKAIAVVLGFSLLSWAVSLIPNLFNLLSDFVRLFKGSFYPEFIYGFFNVLTTLVSILRGILLVYLALVTSKEKSIKLPLIEPILEKVFD